MKKVEKDDESKRMINLKRRICDELDNFGEMELRLILKLVREVGDYVDDLVKMLWKIK